MDKDIKITIKELVELLIIKVLQNRLNYTLNGLTIGLKSDQSIGRAIIPPKTQIPTLKIL